MEIVGTTARPRVVRTTPGAGPTIFVAIPSYRDPQLVPTVENCIARAVRPGALRFGICWQQDPTDRELSFGDDKHVRVVEYHWRESRGIGWARAQCMSLFQGEDFYLQLDSHHRFVEGWDEKLLRCMEATGSPRPVLTSFGRNLDLSQPNVMPRALPRILFGRWDGNIPHFRPGATPVRERLNRPMRARSISGHFCFTIGDFVGDVPCDPEIYHYGGGEITVAVRAFTSGYDLFQPPEPILSHAYGPRVDLAANWRKDKPDWMKLDQPSKERIADFLTNPHLGKYGCGTARTMADYEAYAGLSFRHCRAQDYTHLNREPPNPFSPSDWAERPQRWNVQLNLKPPGLPAGFDTARSWRVSLTDAFGSCIHEEVIGASDILRLFVAATQAIDLSFQSAREPAAWSLGADGPLGELRVRGPVGRGTKHGQAFIKPSEWHHSAVI